MSNIIRSLPYSNRISPWLTEFGPLLWQAKQTMSASACHIGRPIYVNPGELALVYGTPLWQSQVTYIFSHKLRTFLAKKDLNPSQNWILFFFWILWILWRNEVLLNFLFFFAANTAGETSGAPHNAEIRIIPQSAATVVNVAPPTYEESC